MTARPLVPECLRRPASAAVALVLVEVITILIATVQPVCADNADNLSISISSIEEGGIIYSDVIGSNIPIYVDIFSTNGIDEVTVIEGINRSPCRKLNQTRYLCLNRWNGGLNSVNITATDKLGYSVSQLRTYTLKVGLNPPPLRSTTNTQQTSLPAIVTLGAVSLIALVTLIRK